VAGWYPELTFVNPKQKILNHGDTEDTEVCHRESSGTLPIGNLIGMVFLTSIMNALRSLSSVFSVPLW
jgi:hypothetical protein